MPVTVRMFAALREAAGTSETEASAGEVAEILSELEQRYGEPFSTRLGAASLLVDGEPVARDAGVELADGAELVLLPPFSGGATPWRVTCAA